MLRLFFIIPFSNALLLSPRVFKEEAVLDSLPPSTIPLPVYKVAKKGFKVVVTPEESFTVQVENPKSKTQRACVKPQTLLLSYFKLCWALTIFQIARSDDSDLTLGCQFRMIGKADDDFYCHSISSTISVERFLGDKQIRSYTETSIYNQPHFYRISDQVGNIHELITVCDIAGNETLQVEAALRLYFVRIPVQYISKNQDLSQKDKDSFTKHRDEDMMDPVIITSYYDFKESDFVPRLYKEECKRVERNKSTLSAIVLESILLDQNVSQGEVVKMALRKSKESNILEVIDESQRLNATFLPDSITISQRAKFGMIGISETKGFSAYACIMVILSTITAFNDVIAEARSLQLIEEEKMITNWFARMILQNSTLDGDAIFKQVCVPRAPTFFILITALMKDVCKNWKAPAQFSNIFQGESFRLHLTTKNEKPLSLIAKLEFQHLLISCLKDGPVRDLKKDLSSAFFKHEKTYIVEEIYEVDAFVGERVVKTPYMLTFEIQRASFSDSGEHVGVKFSYTKELDLSKFLVSQDIIDKYAPGTKVRHFAKYTLYAIILRKGLAGSNTYAVVIRRPNGALNDWLFVENGDIKVIKPSDVFNYFLEIKDVSSYVACMLFYVANDVYNQVIYGAPKAEESKSREEPQNASTEYASHFVATQPSFSVQRTRRFDFLEDSKAADWGILTIKKETSARQFFDQHLKDHRLSPVVYYDGLFVNVSPCSLVAYQKNLGIKNALHQAGCLVQKVPRTSREPSYPVTLIEDPNLIKQGGVYWLDKKKTVRSFFGTRIDYEDKVVYVTMIGSGVGPIRVDPDTLLHTDSIVYVIPKGSVRLWKKKMAEKVAATICLDTVPFNKYH